MTELSRRDCLKATGGAALCFGISTELVLAPVRALAQAVAQADSLAFRSATELASMLQEREVSSVDLTQYFIQRIERFDDLLNAVVVRDFDRALDAAAMADESLAQGDQLGQLHGLPMTIKEAFDVSGLPTTWGVPEQLDNIATGDAAVVERFKASGAHILGKTNVPLRLGDWQSYNDIYGTTNNPWDVSKSPGGSSGGSAAALAAGLTSLEFGSDIGGSIRYPSHFCGTYGHKPTYGIVPTRGHSLPGVVAAPDLNVVGPMARSAEDLALALDVVAGAGRLQAPGWRLSLPESRVNSLRDLRVAIWPASDIAPVSSEISDRVQEIGDMLARSGATVSDSARPDISAADSHYAYLSLLGSAQLANLPDDVYASNQQQAEQLDANDESPLAVLSRARVQDHRSWSELNDIRTDYRLRWKTFFEDWDLVICPVSATTAYDHDHRPKVERMLTVDDVETTHYEQFFWVGLATVAYLPSTVFPTGPSRAGLPIGLQAIGAEYADLTTIEATRLIAQEIGGFRPPPGYGD